MLVKALIDFISFFDKYKKDQQWTKEQIITGVLSKTVDWLQVNGEIKALVRFNVVNDGRVADILDLRITDKRGIEIMKLFARRAKRNFPSLEYIRFERGIKYPGKKHKMVDIEWFIT